MLDTARMVKAWVAAHGGPRRFPRGESTDFFAVQAWLHQRGIGLSSVKGSYWIRRGDGAPRRQAKWRDVIALVDRLRVEEGREPIVRSREVDRESAARCLPAADRMVVVRL